MSEKVLFIDDDANLLAGIRRTLRGHFEVVTAVGGQEGLEQVRDAGPFAVIVADMRMPGMDGIQVLAQARDLAPESVRMMLTGNADLDTAMQAVNQGHIFRFLTKPCPQETLLKTVQAGIQQYWLVIAERQLLEETLNGSIKMLTDILAMVKPKAFGRANRVRRFARHIAETLGIPDVWKYEVAAMLSQLGCLMLPEETLDRVYAGRPLTPEERQACAAHPDIGGRLLVNIPRLEEVAHMIAQQAEPFSWDRSAFPPAQRDVVALGAHILKVVLDFDHLLSLGVVPELAIAKLREHSETYDPVLVEALAGVPLKAADACRRALRVADLEVRMIFDQDVRASNGTLLVTRGQEATVAILEHLKRWSRGVGVEEPISMLVARFGEAPAPA